MRQALRSVLPWPLAETITRDCRRTMPGMRKRSAGVKRSFRNDKYLPGMDEFRARRVTDALRDRGVNAHLLRGGLGQFGVRVSLPGGREAEWDTDGTAGLEAQVMRDGMLVGYVPQIEGSEDFSEPQIVQRHRPHRLRPAHRQTAHGRPHARPRPLPAKAASSAVSSTASATSNPPFPRRLPLPVTGPAGHPLRPSHRAA